MSGRFVVVGAGTMGAGIAYVAAQAGYETTIVEVNDVRAAAITGHIATLADKAVARGKLTTDDAMALRKRLFVVKEFGDIDPQPTVLVEAVPERLELKRDVLSEAAKLNPTVLGSNTSSISISELASQLDKPERFCGLHFFNPVYAMPLLEIVTGTKTSDETTRNALDIAKRLAKQPIVVADSPGFATSRLGVALGIEAIRMCESGVASAADIDKAMVLGYRHPMGPLELTDIVGLDVRLDICKTLEKAYGDRFAPPKLLVDMVADGKLGKKSGQGFYVWNQGKKETE